jgi:hypothetical protein
MAENPALHFGGPIVLHDTINKYKFEPQRTNHFEVYIPDLGDNFALAVNTFSLPNITNDPIEIAHGNSRRKYAGQTAFGGAETLEVTDYIGLDVEAIVNNWRLKVYDPQTDMMGLAADYKKNGTVTEYAPDGERLRVWNIHGMWPSGVAFGDTLSMDGSEVKKITLTIAYDRGFRDTGEFGTISAQLTPTDKSGFQYEKV